MQVKFELQDSFRKKIFIESGKNQPSSVELDVPLEEISPRAREVLAGFGLGVSKVTLVLPPHKTWQARFLPETVQQWNELLLAYQVDYEQAKAAQEEKEHQNQLEQLAQVTSLLHKCEQLLSSDEQPGWRLMGEIKSFNWNLTRLPGYAEALKLREHVNALMEEREATQKARAAAAEEERRQCARQYHADKPAWIANQGSEHLKGAFSAGYCCERLYLVERAKKEHPGYVVDLDNTADWTSVDDPSPEALTEAKRSGGLVVWLTKPVRHKSKGSGQDEDAWGEDYDDYFIPCEAVVIRGYLGRNDVKLVRTI